MPGGELLYPSPQHLPATPPQQPHPTIITTATSELLEDETWVWSQIKAEARRDAESEPDLASRWDGKSGCGFVVLIDVLARITVAGNPARLVGGKEKTSRHEDVPGESMSFISEWSV
ncbi:hypothetical protein C5167_044142 [Papaver somniferum]|uniref:Uncharacterized protein n=1 Tax=Papaver somniferum TaxID=3469 RepID=A0A4Y7L9A6_PAPSO|nr:hypothetical protein C5167_044142 [Papaver somniferum]